ncbi:RsmF rRNA methyltransferase first C-terminal domain-containing protein, partial [Enterocloster citroniae]|uniref:RsmF rRNA methyltransferase first C-terminal domain-containing protein n=1 Tax=Enterocloster citroniae TaxID=358743 RepID=UPI00349E5E53
MTDISKLPERFLAEMKELLGDEYNDYVKSFEENWKPGLRANTLKISPEKLKAMVPWPMEPVPWTGKGFYYGQEDETKESVRPSKHPAYYCGLYYLQEPSAMTPAAMLPVEPGDRVLDLCAAPGGKSTELGARLMGQGLLVSNDISYSRARALLKNLELAGIPNICVTSESPEKLALVWRGFFDKILVDAPCSGEGMFRREEDMVKDWTVHGPSYYAPLQRQIACQAVDMLKPGGMLLYSTCTFSRTEDEENIEYILDQYPQMELCALDLSRVPGAVNGIGLDGCMRLFPHRVKGEGHFLALLRKKDGETASPRRTREIPGMLKHQEELMDFLESISVTFDHSRIRIHQDSVYYLPKGLEWNLPLRFLRTGLLLGEVKKGRFEPSQALAMALRAGQFKTTIRLEPEDDRVLRYLKGETL